MIELRIHGRGGQGAVVASKTLAQAAFLTGRYVQSYPDYGVERRGAPVVAFARIAEPGDDLFVRATDIVALDDLLTAIEHEVPVKAEENRAAAVEAYEMAGLGVTA